MAEIAKDAEEWGTEDACERKLGSVKYAQDSDSGVRASDN